MATLPTRATTNTAAEHVADHNTLHDFYNTPGSSGHNLVGAENNWTATQRFIGVAGTIILGVQLAADSQARARFTGDGLLQWSDGTATPDVELKRAAANVLQLSDEFRVSRAVAGDDAVTARLDADTSPRFVVNADGKIEWGPGNAALDANLERAGVASLKTTSIFRIERSASSTALDVRTTADTNPRMRAQTGGELEWGPGNAVTDVSLSRSSANTLDLASGDSLRIIDGTLQLDPVGLTVFFDSKAAPSFGVHSLVISRAAGNVVSILRAAASQTANMLTIENSAAAIQSRFDKSGYFMTRRVAAPADADIATSELAYWFDNTPASTAVKFKGKDSAGTVKTATVAMA